MPVRYQLPNGLTVLFQPQHAARVAAFQVWVRVGSADERPDQAGLAHLHEHMLFKGTATRGPGEIARAIEGNGGEINAWTSFDQTVYHVVIASPFAQAGLEILGDAVRRPAFDEGELGREIEVVCEEIKRSLDSPSRRASRDLFETAFSVHDYRRPVIGWEETVRSFTREKVLEFYHRHYAPQNMVLTVVGDVQEAALRGWVEEIFGGDWDRQWTGPVARAPEPPATSRRYKVREDEVKEAYLNLAFPIPDVLHEDTPALDVLAMIAGQGEASRLTLEVKRKRGLVNDIHAYAYTPKDPGLFAVSLTLPADKLEAATEEAVRLLAELRAQAVDEAELRTVQALIESENVYQRETVQGLARKLGYYEASGGGIEREARYYEKVAALTPDAVRAVAEKYLDFDRLVGTALVPPGTAFDDRALDGVVDRALAAAPRPASDRPARPLPPAPMQVVAPLAARRPAGEVVAHTLSSGATVLIREEAAVPLFAIRAAFLGGVRYESPAQNGLTTLLARTFTRGTSSRSAEAITHAIDDLQGSLAATGGRNSVMVRGEFLSRHFDRAFDLFSDVVLDPAFPEEELARERALLLQDVLTREDKPAGVAMDLFAQTLFEKHPYRMPLLGTAQSVEALGREDLVGYHRRHLDPSRLVLGVVGDVRVDEVLARAEAAFGRSKGAGAPPSVQEEPPPQKARVARRALQKAQTHLVLGFRGARIDEPWRRALEVLSTVLSGQGGRLFVELRDKRSMAYSVSSFTVEGLERGWFAVYMGTSPEKVEDALGGIRAELRRVCEEKVSADELLRARRHLVGTHEIGLQRNGARASVLALEYLYGLGTDALRRYAEEIDAVTADDVLEAARRVVDLDRETLAIVGPQAQH
jgi:zinc protease